MNKEEEKVLEGVAIPVLNKDDRTSLPVAPTVMAKPVSTAIPIIPTILNQEKTIRKRNSAILAVLDKEEKAAYTVTPETLNKEEKATPEMLNKGEMTAP